MQGYEPFAALNEIQERLFLRRGDLSDIGVNDKAVVARQLRGIEVLYPIGVLDVDAAWFQYRDQLPGTIVGPVVAVVTEEESRYAILGAVEDRGRHASQAYQERGQK